MSMQDKITDNFSYVSYLDCMTFVIYLHVEAQHAKWKALTYGNI